MKYIKGFFAFWYDFIIGDAWEVAAGVAVCLVALYLLAHYATSSMSASGCTRTRFGHSTSMAQAWRRPTTECCRASHRG